MFRYQLRLFRRFSTSRVLPLAQEAQSTNPQMQFPCIDKRESLNARLREGEGRDPSYQNVQSGFKVFESHQPLFLDFGGVLPEYRIAYETWGSLNTDKSNAVLLHTGLSGSSHAKSHPDNTKPGWWETFIGPDKPIDTNKFFVICTNVIGGCYGSTGPSCPDPVDGKPYASRFPMLSIQDIVRAQNRLVKSLGINKLHASVGSSMGGMQCLAYGQEFPSEVEKIVSVSGCAKSHPHSIGMRHTQRQALMADPNWNRGFYYDGIPPHSGLKLAREIATITYRSGPEWESRFGSERIDPEASPLLCADFLVETYLDHQGAKFCLEYDANSFLYLSKTMDLFDLSKSNRERALRKRSASQDQFLNRTYVPELPAFDAPVQKPRRRRTTLEESKEDLIAGVESFSDKKVLVIGVQSDILFPVWQQREIAEILKVHGTDVTYVELDETASLYGHDTFLLELEHVGGPIKRFL